MTVRIIGAGLAGCEAALTLSRLNINVELADIKPKSFTKAHSNPDFGELVCSNSLKGTEIATSNGLLKAELRLFLCRLLEIAETVRVPAGGALAVDRTAFAQKITEEINNSKNIHVICKEITSIDPDIPTIIASGPLTTDKLADSLKELIGAEYLYFFDALAPIIDAETIDYSKTFKQSRYGKGGADYLNCPLNKEEYLNFVSELVGAKRVRLKDFEGTEVFEGCMPIEVLASRGENSLRFGPLKPIGLTCKDGTKPYAVVQLRLENTAMSSYNIVGFQTNLTFPEQKRIFSMIPALKNCEFLRYGVMHRNTFLNAPKVLSPALSLKNSPKTFIAGQLTGVEGYVESIATGLITAKNVYNYLNGKEHISLPYDTMLGSIFKELQSERHNFQPVASNFGILPALDNPSKNKKERYLQYAQRALDALKSFN